MASLAINKFVICYMSLALIAVLGVCVSQFGGEDVKPWGLWLVFGSFVGVPLTAFITRLGHD